MMTTASKTRARLGDLLVDRGAITREQLRRALEIQRQGQQEKLLGEILIDLDYASPEQVLSAVAEGCGVPFVQLTPQLVDPEARSTLPEPFVQKHGVLPLFHVRNVLTVALSEPANVFLVDEIGHVADMSVQVVAATADNIYDMLEQTRSEDGGPGAAQEVEPGLALSDEVLQPEDFDSAYGSWPPEKVAGLLLREAVRSRADAIHLEPEQKVLRIRFRIDGSLHVVMRPPVRLASGLLGAFREMAVLPGGDPSAEGRAHRIQVQGQSVQIRLLSLDGAFGTRTVIRLVRDDQAQLPLEKLGCDFNLLAAYKDLVAAHRGLIAVAGPRGCGATTTLYSTLHALDPVRLNVCTFERSIAYHLSGINQFSPATCGITDPAEAVRRLLAQQPDVLMLDDCVGPDVLEAILEPARDGCLVLAGVRAVDAPDAIARLTSWVGPDGAAETLRGVLGQRLVRTVCPDCKTSYEPPASLKRRIVQAVGPIEDSVKGRGCPACRRTGYVGRIGLFELVENAGPVADVVAGGKDVRAIRDAAEAAGSPSLWIDGVNKVKAGITSLDEVIESLAGCPGPDWATPDDTSCGTGAASPAQGKRGTGSAPLGSPSR